MTPIEKNTEALLLTCALAKAVPCDRQCGRLATVEAYWSPGLCDVCWAEYKQHPLTKDEQPTRELGQAKRARRLEALLKGEP